MIVSHKFHLLSFVFFFAAKQNGIAVDMGWTGNELHVVHTMIWSVISSLVECGGKLAASLLVMLCCKEGMESGGYFEIVWIWYNNRRQAWWLMFFEQEGVMTLSLQKNYIDVSTHLYTISHYINWHVLEHTGMPCIILPYFSVTKYGKLSIIGTSVYLLILVCHYACFVTLKQGKGMSKSMPGCKICASQYNNIIIMASYK